MSSILQALQKKLAAPTDVALESEEPKSRTEPKATSESVVVPRDASPKPSAGNQKDVIEIGDESQPGGEPGESSYPYRTWPPPDRQETPKQPESPGASHAKVATPEPEVGQCGVPWVRLQKSMVKALINSCDFLPWKYLWRTTFSTFKLQLVTVPTSWYWIVQVKVFVLVGICSPIYSNFCISGGDQWVTTLWPLWDDQIHLGLHKDTMVCSYCFGDMGSSSTNASTCVRLEHALGCHPLVTWLISWCRFQLLFDRRHQRWRPLWFMVMVESNHYAPLLVIWGKNLRPQPWKMRFGPWCQLRWYLWWLKTSLHPSHVLSCQTHPAMLQGIVKMNLSLSRHLSHHPNSLTTRSKPGWGESSYHEPMVRTWSQRIWSKEYKNINTRDRIKSLYEKCGYNSDWVWKPF